VASPIEDTPGFRAGIQAGDLIISVNGTDTSTITMEEVLDILRGKVGEKVDLLIRRGKNMEFPVTLVRAIIEVPTVKYGKIGNTGYLKIIEFTPQTAERVQQALDSFGKSITGLIIDLRNNPGGLITSVADVADKFIDSGTIVSTKSRLAFENSVFTASSRKTTFKGLPIVVLINKGSASASEILSGALKDNHLAYLVGQRTYGKGSVQQVIPLSGTDKIKITMARYYTPSDVNIDKIGIPPDREILFPTLSENGEKQYADLLKGNEVEKYVEAHPNMTEQQIASYAKTLRAKYNEIDERNLRKLVRNEVNRKVGTMLYDLDWDIQLTEALSILAKENFSELVKKTKTLKELQDEVEKKEKTEKK
ncbi:MAG: S41 family peptidase, partial [Treponema sp.]|nr:S41 family peptidase [Treponema sp.]